MEHPGNDLEKGRGIRHLMSGVAAGVLALGLLCTSGAGQGGSVRAVSMVSAFPGQAWDKIEKPESVGYSSARLQALRAWLESLDTTAMMVSVGGRSLFEYGDLAHLSYLASVRKSVLAILYGKYVENGTIPLDKTLGRSN